MEKSTIVQIIKKFLTEAGGGMYSFSTGMKRLLHGA